MGNSNIKILILGHNGMLGHIAYKFFKQYGFAIETVSDRFPSKNFSDFLQKSNCDFVLNCIGSIPQKNPENYDANHLIPQILCDKFNGIIIHPSSDCENHAISEYDISKKKGTEIILNHCKSHVIQCSIIGPEKLTSYGLWSWLENNKNDKVFGYSNHLWNGVTTLDWCKISLDIIKDKISEKKIIAGTNVVSKFDLLSILNDKLRLNKNIVEITHENYINRALNPSIIRDDINIQIQDLISWKNINNQ